MNNMEISTQIFLHLIIIFVASLAVTYFIHQIIVIREATTLYSVNYTAYKITESILEAARKAFTTKASTMLIIELNMPYDFEILNDFGNYKLRIKGFSIYTSGGSKITSLDFNLPRASMLRYEDSSGKCNVLRILASYDSDNNLVLIKVSSG